MFKKLIKLLLVLFIVFSTNQDVVMADETLSLSDAINTMENYISESVNVGDNDWLGFHIKSYSDIYDANLNKYGFVFELSNNTKNGYGIVVKNVDNSYIVVEASNENESPYAYNFDNLNVYYTPLEYYSYSSVSLASETKELNNLIDYSSISSEKVSFDRFVYNQNKSTTRAVETSYKLVSQYYSKFEKHKQNSSTSCVPSSFAMSLKYLHNIGSLTLSTTYQNMTNIETKLCSLAGCVGSKCYASSIKSAVKTFSDNYITGAVIRTKDDAFYPDRTLSEARTEINNNCPPIIILHAGVLSTNPNDSHAVTMVGYKKVNGNYTNYIEVVDPWDGIKKSVLWNDDNVWGYMLIYFW